MGDEIPTFADAFSKPPYASEFHRAAELSARSQKAQDFFVLAYVQKHVTEAMGDGIYYFLAPDWYEMMRIKRCPPGSDPLIRGSAIELSGDSGPDIKEYPNGIDEFIKTAKKELECVGLVPLIEEIRLTLLKHGLTEIGRSIPIDLYQQMVGLERGIMQYVAYR